MAKDGANPDAIWITEVWDSKASHEASLSLPRVQASIRKAMPLAAGFEESVETEPVGGTPTRGLSEGDAALRLTQMGGADPEAKAPPRRRARPK